MTDGNEYTSPPPAPSGEVSSEDKTMALIAHLIGIVAPLIIWQTNKDNASKSFLVGQAKEALNFHITALGAIIVAVILTIVSFGLLFFLPTLVGLAVCVMCIIGGIKAYNGETYRYPFAFRLIK